jgi:glycosyltransferase involved in cell wall biosynthesis
VRILLVSAYGLPHIGGVEVIIDELARQLTSRGHEITHVTSSAGAGVDDHDTPYGVLRIHAANLLETRLGVPYPIFAPRLLTLLRREIARADVVHAHGFIYPGTVAAFGIARRAVRPPPLVLTEHVGHVPYDSSLLNAIEGAAIRILGRRTLRRADVVVTYNDRVGDQLSALCPSIERQTILNGVDHQLFRPAAGEERSRLRTELGWDERPRALFVGRPVAKKGFPAAVAAVRDTPNQVVLAVAGSERLPAGTPQGVEALGRLSHRRLAQIYRASDVLLVPSWGEGFPLIAQEGLASGLPLLLAKDPGYGPNLNGAGAALREIEGSGEFAGALTELLTDPTTLTRARAAATAHARSTFSWPRAATEHEDLYRRLQGGQGSPSPSIHGPHS